MKTAKKTTWKKTDLFKLLSPKSHIELLNENLLQKCESCAHMSAFVFPVSRGPFHLNFMGSKGIVQAEKYSSRISEGSDAPKVVKSQLTLIKTAKS